MSREFDDRAYADALQKFIIGMEQVHDERSPLIRENMALLAGFLRLGSATATLYDDEAAERRGDGIRVVFYDCGDVREDAVLQRRETLRPGRVIRYTFHLPAGEAEWNDEEQFRLTTLINLLNVFNRRMMVMKVGQYHTTHEFDFGMYNLSFFMRRVGEYNARHMIDKFGACYFNMKRMSSINAEYGRDQGTKLIKEFLTKLDEILTDSRELICRIGGDNFAVLFRKDHLEGVLRHLEGISIPVGANGEIALLSAWAGVYMLPESVQNPEEVIDSIAFAINVAKSTRSEKAVFFDGEMVARLKEGRRVQFLFPEALQKEEFLIYYQPKVELKNYHLVGAEALCRWVHEGETILPFKFIPVLEQSSRICQLDFYMLEHVCRDIRRWMDEGREIVRISVNFSRRHFDERHLLEHIVEIIDRNRVPHKYIEIELTETSADVSFRDVRELLDGLKREGIAVSVDDFGTGYSSLNLIRELPWDVLKLDKSFMDFRDKNDGKGQMMFGHVIAMARELGMECITEGVETVEQIQVLKENGCFLAQGYFFDKPLPIAEFEIRLNQNDNQK